MVGVAPGVEVFAPGVEVFAPGVAVAPGVESFAPGGVPAGETFAPGVAVAPVGKALASGVEVVVAGVEVVAVVDPDVAPGVEVFAIDVASRVSSDERGANESPMSASRPRERLLRDGAAGTLRVSTSSPGWASAGTTSAVGGSMKASSRTRRGSPDSVPRPRRGSPRLARAASSARVKTPPMASSQPPIQRRSLPFFGSARRSKLRRASVPSCAYSVANVARAASGSRRRRTRDVVAGARAAEQERRAARRRCRSVSRNAASSSRSGATRANRSRSSDANAASNATSSATCV